MTCWNEYGSPAIDNPKVREAARLAAKVYETETTGGNLHVTLDDFNIEDSSIGFCLTMAPDETHPLLPVEKECGELLLSMTIEERASALALWNGWWGDPRRVAGAGA